MPWDDWQFWVVTLAAMGGAVMVARALLPRSKPRKRVELTIKRERISGGG